MTASTPPAPIHVMIAAAVTVPGRLSGSRPVDGCGA